MTLPSEIIKYVKDLKYKKDNIGRSDDSVIIFENKYILKISKDINKLYEEYLKTTWLSDKLPVSKTIYFVQKNNNAYFLRTYLEGKTLISEEFLTNPIKLIKLIKKANILLDSINSFKCPFNSKDNSGSSFIHGDLCLPNILIKDDEISGFIDLDNAGCGDKWYDLSWLIWSFEYNLKTNKYTNLLLDELNITFDEGKFNQFIPIEYRTNLKNN